MSKQPKNQKLSEAAKKVKTISGLRRLLEIKDWDYIIIGDGSGTTWEKPCGWGCSMIENRTWVVEAFYGAFNQGTNIVAEIMAYVQPLLVLSERRERKCQSDGATLVHIVTDCQYVRNTGNLRAAARGKKHRALWHLIDSLRRSGIIVKFHWIPRDLLKANQFSHTVANAARKSLSGEVSKGLDSASAGSLNALLPPYKKKKRGQP